MSWSGFFSGEKSDGSSGKVSDVSVNVKSDKSGNVKEVLVNNSGGNAHKNHDHYYEKSSGWWGKSSKGKG